MKKLTRDRVVPIISASVSWLIFAIIGSGMRWAVAVHRVFYDFVSCMAWQERQTSNP
ncbi:MAG: hypothetical protein ACLP4V_10350 [Methylocella sp.]